MLYPIKVTESGNVTFESTGGDLPITKLEDTVLRHEYDVPTGILPPVVRYIHPTRQIVVFDRPPTQMTINYYGKPLNKVASATHREVDVWLPWTMYCIYLSDGVISNIYLYAINGPFNTRKKELRLLPIPNYYNDGRFCQPEEKQPYSSIADAVATAYQIVWNSSYNTDTTEVVKEYYNYYGGLDKVFTEGWQHIHAEDARRHSPAALLEAWGKLTKEEVLNTRWMKSALVPRMAYLPTMKYTPTPTRYVNHVNGHRVKTF